MVINKRAQFFLLASVIIVAVVISLGVTSNQVIVKEEPKDFYDFSDGITKEVGAVIDYGIYSGFDDDVNLNEFVDLLTEDIKDKYPDADFVIVYGDNASGVNVKNERTDSIEAEGENIEGSRGAVMSSICHGFGNSHFCEDIELDAENFDEDIGRWKIDADKLQGKDAIQIEVGGQIVEFPVSEHKRVLFIIQKDVGDESFVAIG